MKLVVTEIREKCVAIVMFGPATDSFGYNPGTFFQVTIDPKCISPSGKFIRFGHNDGDEIQGWQRCEAMTVVEILGVWDDEGTKPTLQYGNQGVALLLAPEEPDNQ